MKKVRNFILFACAVLVLQMQVVYSKNEKPGKNVSQETIEKIKAEDKNLATLLDNALFLVNQIKDNDHDEDQGYFDKVAVYGLNEKHEKYEKTSRLG